MSFNLKTQIQPPIIIVGLARSGLAAKKLLLASGFQEKDILTFDENKPEAQIKTDAELYALTDVKTAVISPGVSLKKKFIQKWRDQGVVITSEINLALSQVTTEKIVGITGSLGKSTTTSIIGEGIRSFDPKVFVGGNLGIPFCEYALSIHKEPGKKAEWIVLELSSYQLENVENLSVDYSLVTFLSANHLERYSSLSDYYETKWTLLDRTKNKMLLNGNGGDLCTFTKDKKSEKLIWSYSENAELAQYGLDKADLIGKHNQDNLAMAALLGAECGFPASYFNGIKSFRGLSHRLENLGLKKNIIFINDSKATTIDSVKAAVVATKESFPNLKINLLLGGRDKKLPWIDLKPLASDPRINLFFFGEHGLNIKQTLGSPAPEFRTLDLLLRNLTSGILGFDSIVLFSPGGVSQDEFSSFESRGDFFRQWFEKF
jgi:UDP-N-acetylmuramoylalanine--D-glutamate ligase